MLVPTPKHKNEEKKRKVSKQSRESKESKESQEEKLIHEFVTQVPNSHPLNLKESVEQSLRKNTF